MLTKLRYWWQEKRSSFWFVPTVMVLDAVVLATILIVMDTNLDQEIVERWPLLFGSGAAGARGLLTTVASSMITVAGLVFSITILALSQTSSQYTSRVIRNFMRNRVNQSVLGVFVGIFAYCLVVLRTIRGGDEGMFVPALAVLVGLLFAFVGIGVLIFFIHHISMSIQASSIIAGAAQETMLTVDKLFPERLDDNDDENRTDALLTSLVHRPWTAISAWKTGYIESVNMSTLFAIAQEQRVILRMDRGVGEFIIQGTPLVSVMNLINPSDEMTARLNSIYIISNQRTVDQDASFGIRQIVDIAMKALSPGINDTTTAIMCVDYLAAIMVQLATRRIEPPQFLENGELRVIARGPSFESLLSESFDQVRQHGASNVAIMLRMLGALQTIAGQTTNSGRCRHVENKVQCLADLAESSIEFPHDREKFQSRLTQVRESFVRC
ncbi:DUF2254 domain-containing protein [Desulfopila sp. IMCC35008]|uniref:DUF2254 domain-containing protein n=1 Tax=Desulfopila sp. IMCC35008 TaxID=2653858 RepID=UPI0013D6DA6E|nr:DUF2254 domain-containing protein [Desulfopila sp. IMCC35008]